MYIFHGEIETFLDNYPVDCVVSPANSFGIMDGGFDAALTDYFGYELQNNVRKYISENFFGEQPVGTSFITDTPKDGIRIIHTPTMRVPERIIDPSVVYHCTRSTLICAENNSIGSIVIPAFDGSTGGVNPEILAKMMWLAVKQVRNPVENPNWEYALDSHFRNIKWF